MVLHSGYYRVFKVNSQIYPIGSQLKRVLHDMPISHAIIPLIDAIVLCT